jgi:hypothetical protein
MFKPPNVMLSDSFVLPFEWGGTRRRRNSGSNRRAGCCRRRRQSFSPIPMNNCNSRPDEMAQKCAELFFSRCSGGQGT